MYYHHKKLHRASRFFNGALALLAVFLFLLGLMPIHAYSQIPYVSEAQADADWLMGAVLTSGSMDGAIASYPDKQHIRPYMANLAALGLVRATEVTGDTKYINAVWDYASWYANHLDGSNYMHDYDLINGSWVAAPNAVLSNPYDSTDAYAGTYLMMIRAAYRVNPDIAKLASLRLSLHSALAAIASTTQSDGLSWATPTYTVKLLMDNVESYQGLRAAEQLGDILDDTSLQSSAKSYADSAWVGLESLWSSSNGYYYWARHANGAQQAVNWGTLNPDTMTQGWTTAFLVATGARANNLLNQISLFQPYWDKPGSNGGTYDDIAMGWGFAAVGNTSRALSAAANFRSAAIAANRAWPFTTMAAGELIVLETLGTGTVFDTLSPPPAAAPAGQGGGSSSGGGGAQSPSSGGTSTATGSSSTNNSTTRPAAAPNSELASNEGATSSESSNSGLSAYVPLKSVFHYSIENGVIKKTLSEWWYIVAGELLLFLLFLLGREVLKNRYSIYERKIAPVLLLAGVPHKPPHIRAH